MRNAVLIDDADNVVVAIEPISAGSPVVYVNREGASFELVAADDIPLYHKVARRPIARGEAVVKYGEYIGVATQDICQGAHVHTHNCISTDGLRAAEEVDHD